MAADDSDSWKQTGAAFAAPIFVVLFPFGKGKGVYILFLSQKRWWGLSAPPLKTVYPRLFQTASRTRRCAPRQLPHGNYGADLSHAREIKG